MPGKGKKKAGGFGLARFFHILVTTPVRQMLLTIIMLAIIWWQWNGMVALGMAIWRLLGWGLFIIIAAVLTLGIIIGLRKYGTFVHHWNRWLAGIVFALVAWGVMAFFGVGGQVGLGIAGSTGFIGVLRLLALTLVGLVSLFPAASFRLIASFFLWLSELFKKNPSAQPGAKPPVAQAVAVPAFPLPSQAEDIESEAPEPKPAPREKAVRAASAEPAQPGSPKDLKQVAQEVWKKYGQSSQLTIVDGWKLPPMEILERSPEIEFSQADNAKRAKLIEEALASYGVEAKVVQINTGPTVTQFGVEPGWDRKFKEIKEKDKDGNVSVRQEEVSKIRVKVERITSLANDMALALAAPSIRMEAPVPGKSIVGIEVPNTTSSVVSLRGVVETSACQKLLAKSRMTVALGKGAGGEAIAADLTKMPHLLIAGATGSGKTVCLNTIISCLLLHNTPNDVRFIMVDPKRVELTPYNSIPHLAAPVIVDPQKALLSLRWLGQEMDQRYQKLASSGARNIEGFNKTRQGPSKMPYIILIIDELADLMMTGYDEVETIICRLAQLARAVGIHLVVATQRPSVDVITGLIKANFPTRISFAVTFQVDSRTILDGGGAEKLLGRGDMLYMPTEAAKPKRLQGCFMSDAEMERLVYFWGSQQKEDAGDLKIADLVPAAAQTSGAASLPADPLLDTARQLAKQGHISTSFLQRKLHIGYPRAARLFELLEEEGIKGEVEEVDGEKPPPV